jgi:putative Flp pilus-assembly TadE/G-like protein
VNAGNESGAVTILVAVSSLVFAVGGVTVADAGAMLVARAQAQTAADAAALAAVVEQIPVLSHGEAPRDAARAEAERNGATLVTCACDPGSSAATVEVEVVPRLLLIHAWAGRRVRARAAAGVDDDLLSYRTASPSPSPSHHRAGRPNSP